MTVLQHWGGHWKVQGREGDQRLLGEGLSEEREAKRGGGAGPRWWQATGGFGQTM